MIESYAEQDPNCFLAVASQIAAHAARTGKEKLAQEFRHLIDDARGRQSEVRDRSQSIPIAQPTGELSGPVAAVFPKTRLADAVLPAGLQERLQRVITESNDS